MKRMFMAAAICGLFAGAEPALALEAEEAKAVISILEQLAPERGERVYPEAAEDWFEYDQDDRRLIEAAGFDLESWDLSYESTVMAYLASLSDDEFLGRLREAEHRLAASDIDAQAREELLRDLRAEMARLTQRREAAKADIHAVTPLLARLTALVDAE